MSARLSGLFTTHKPGKPWLTSTVFKEMKPGMRYIFLKPFRFNLLFQITFKGGLGCVIMMHILSLSTAHALIILSSAEAIDHTTG